ncbi:DUF3489 domain-containing protein [Hyphomicrobium sp. 802]|uniref:DUF3489 domain-containing protein n=1 Tax=Hyphomicrobium sp. 802 TaxID=1112272 RepID=UPI00045EC1CB|nr:DUF3489 domain-containing protein [Hyphomicrobium sp. 802]
MAKTANANSNAARKPAVALAPETAPAAPMLHPGGKLGVIVERLATKRGATADELVEATGWQRHSVLGALSRLKARGFAFNLDTISGRRAYRLQKG